MQGFTYYGFPGLSDRYVGPDQLVAALTEFSDVASISRIGQSVAGRQIQGLKLGHGAIRVLMWSQMHGNESTTTRALLDLLLAYKRDKGIQRLIAPFTLYIIPMLNPDGAHAYTRNNANDVDLNRNALERKQPEIQTLFSVFETFEPHYCFNLHDQRTRYGVGNPPVPATLSLLAPAADFEKSITQARRVSMVLIGQIANRLLKQGVIGIGRYDDTFNTNCVGDAIISMGVPTLLIESGFYPGDYDREKTREFVYQALLIALDLIIQADLKQGSTDAYFELPQNKSCYVDIHIKNAFPDNKEEQKDLFLNYEEELCNGAIRFVPASLEESYADAYCGHAVYDMEDPADRERVMKDPALSHFFE